MVNRYRDRLTKVLMEDYRDKIEMFITCKCIPPDWLKEMKRETINVNLRENNTLEVIRYCEMGYKWLKPKAIRFSDKLKVAIFGKNYGHYGKELFSVFAIECQNQNGTVADPHLHYLCEYKELITEELVTKVWKGVLQTELPPRAIHIDTPIYGINGVYEATKKVVSYTLKFSSPQFPPDIYPLTEAPLIFAKAFRRPQLVKEG